MQNRPRGCLLIPGLLIHQADPHTVSVRPHLTKIQQNKTDLHYRSCVGLAEGIIVDTQLVFSQIDDLLESSSTLRATNVNQTHSFLVVVAVTSVCFAILILLTALAVFLFHKRLKKQINKRYFFTSPTRTINSTNTRPGGTLLSNSDTVVSRLALEVIVVIVNLWVWCFFASCMVFTGLYCTNHHEKTSKTQTKSES